MIQTNTPPSDQLNLEMPKLRHGRNFELQANECARVLPWGQFKGNQDTRGLRCPNKHCREHKYADCKYCKALPYVSSNLRSQAEEDGTLPHSSPIHKAYLDNRLGVLLEELKNYRDAEQRPLSTRNQRPLVATWSHENAQPLVRAKEQITKMRSKLWTGEHQFEFRLRKGSKSSSHTSRGLFRSQKQSNFSNCF